MQKVETHKKVSELIKEIEKYKEHLCYAYEGEFVGIVILDKEGKETIKIIHLP